MSNYPAGDFRAMPAIGDGHALLKWVTSFPGNSSKGLPTVTGLVLLSDAEDGRLLAVLDAAAVTALRTAAAGVLAADTLCRAEASSYAVIGCGVERRRDGSDARRARRDSAGLGCRRGRAVSSSRIVLARMLRRALRKPSPARL